MQCGAADGVWGGWQSLGMQAEQLRRDAPTWCCPLHTHLHTPTRPSPPYTHPWWLHACRLLWKVLMEVLSIMSPPALLTQRQPSDKLLQKNPSTEKHHCPHKEMVYPHHAHTQRFPPPPWPLYGDVSWHLTQISKRHLLQKYFPLLNLPISVQALLAGRQSVLPSGWWTWQSEVIVGLDDFWCLSNLKDLMALRFWISKKTTYPTPMRATPQPYSPMHVPQLGVIQYAEMCHHCMVYTMCTTAERENFPSSTTPGQIDLFLWLLHGWIHCNCPLPPCTDTSKGIIYQSWFYGGTGCPSTFQGHSYTGRSHTPVLQHMVTSVWAPRGTCHSACLHLSPLSWWYTHIKLDKNIRRVFLPPLSFFFFLSTTFLLWKGHWETKNDKTLSFWSLPLPFLSCLLPCTLLMSSREIRLTFTGVTETD